MHQSGRPKHNLPAVALEDDCHSSKLILLSEECLFIDEYPELLIQHWSDTKSE